jgi:tripartite ATP-independent transporter DctP family solute receptor
MKMKRKVFSVLLILALMVGVFSGCSNSNTAANDEAAKTTETKEPVAEKAEAAKDAYVINLCYENNPGETVDLAANYWKEELEKISGGKMTFKLYPSSQMGNKNEIIDMALAGDPVVTIGNDSFYADLGVKNFNITFAPFLIKSWDDFDALHKSDWYKAQVKELEGLGLHLISNNWRYGVRELLSKKPVAKLEDLKGMKVRTPNSTAETKAFVAMGAAATPMALSEVYTALQQGTIDAVENPLDVLYNGKFQEVAKNLTLTHHIYINASWLFSEKLFQALTDEQKKWLLDSGEAASVYFNKIAEEAVAKSLEDLKAGGVTVVEFDSKDLEKVTNTFAEMDDFKSKWTPGEFEKVKGILGR